MHHHDASPCSWWNHVVKQHRSSSRQCLRAWKASHERAPSERGWVYSESGHWYYKCNGWGKVEREPILNIILCIYILVFIYIYLYIYYYLYIYILFIYIYIIYIYIYYFTYNIEENICIILIDYVYIIIYILQIKIYILFSLSRLFPGIFNQNGLWYFSLW